MRPNRLEKIRQKFAAKYPGISRVMYCETPKGLVFAVEHTEGVNQMHIDFVSMVLEELNGVQPIQIAFTFDLDKFIADENLTGAVVLP